jgi:DNA-binding response OmpR family regulator
VSLARASAANGVNAGARSLGSHRQIGVDRRLAVLIVDRPDLIRQLAGTISAQPIEIVSSCDPAEALLLAGRWRPDLVVLGPVNGRLSALAALEVLRQQEPHLPIIVGVGPDDGRFAAEAAALEPAALVKHPFLPKSLIGLLRSLAPADVSFEVRPLPLDFGRLRIEGVEPEIVLDGVRSTLPMREFMLLRCLAEQAGRVVTRAEIGKAVWGSAGAGCTNTLSVHVMRLRRRLADRDDGPRWITAVRGLGYKFTVPLVDRTRTGSGPYVVE